MLNVLYSALLESCMLTQYFIECAAKSVVLFVTDSCEDDFCKVFNHFCTVLNVPLHKPNVDSRSSDFKKADMEKLLQTWQEESEGTYQCLKERLDEYSMFLGRNIFVSPKYSKCPLMVHRTFLTLGSGQYSTLPSSIN